MTTIQVNRMPAITWHRFGGNEAEIDLPELTAAAADAVVFTVPAALQFTETTINGETALDAGTAPVKEAFDEALASAGSARDQWETGMGEAADAWLDAASNRRIAVVVPEGHVEENTLVIRVNAQDGAAAVAVVDVVAQAHSSLCLALHVDSPAAGSGVAGSRVRVFVGEGARVELASIQTLDSTWQHLDNVGAYVADGGRFVVGQTVLGAAKSYTGLATNLAGLESDAVVDTRYLGHGANTIDFNYLIRQRGVQSTCTLVANGVLMDSSSKVLRGTIDLVHGAKGAVGQENETVLLVNEDVRNKTIPVILCDEDDVQGAHGATIGHVNPEQLGYLRTRGLTADQVEDLFAVATFDYAAAHAFDGMARASVERLGAAVLGSTYDAFREGE